jgi:hypothetical protein
MKPLWIVEFRYHAQKADKTNMLYILFQLFCWDVRCLVLYSLEEEKKLCSLGLHFFVG